MATKKRPQVLPPEPTLTALAPIAAGLVKLQEIDATTKRYAEILDGYTIPDDDEFAAAGEMATKIAGLEKEVLAEYHLAVGDLKAQVDKHDAFFSPIKKRLKESKIKLKGMIGAYMAKKRQAQRELAAAAVAAPVTATGTASASSLISQARAAAAPEVKGVSGKVKMTWELVDFDAVPDDYKMIVLNEDAIQEALDKGVTEILGLSIVESTAVRITAGRKS